MSFETQKVVYMGSAKPGTGGGDSHNLGSFATPEALVAAYPTANPGDFAIVESTDTIWVWDSDNSEWLDTTRLGQVSSVNGKTGDVVIPAIVAISGTSVTQQLATETIYNCGELTALSITFPASPTVSYISQLNFSSGATPTALTAPVGMVWVGDDITNDVFVPVANKRYCVLCFYDGTAMRGIVQAN